MDKLDGLLASSFIKLTSILGNDILLLTSKLGKGGSIMNKEEVLRRSREENKNGDERDKYTRERAINYSLLVVILLLVIVVVFDYLHIIQGEVIINDNTIPVGVFCSFFVFAGSAIECSLHYYYHRKKRYLLEAVLFVLLLLLIIIKFLFGFTMN